MKNIFSTNQPFVTLEDQSVAFVELFFDLIFVFSVTQIVGILHHGFNWASVGQAILVFWLVWWAWTQFTWALNSADTTHLWVKLGTLIATALVFFMAIKPALDHAWASHQGVAQGMLARDVFSLLHFPMLLGVIAFAFAIEEAVSHPSDPLPFTIRFALAFGLAPFVGGMVVCLWRAKKAFFGLGR